MRNHAAEAAFASPRSQGPPTFDAPRSRPCATSFRPASARTPASATAAAVRSAAAASNCHSTNTALGGMRRPRFQARPACPPPRIAECEVHTPQHRGRRIFDGGSECDRLEQATYREDLLDFPGSSSRTSSRRFGRLWIQPSAISSGNAWRMGCRLTPTVRQLLLTDSTAGAQRAAFDCALDPLDDRLR